MHFLLITVKTTISWKSCVGFILTWQRPVQRLRWATSKLIRNTQRRKEFWCCCRVSFVLLPAPGIEFYFIIYFVFSLAACSWLLDPFNLLVLSLADDFSAFDVVFNWVVFAFPIHPTNQTAFLGDSHVPSDIVKAIMERFSANEIQRMSSMEDCRSPKSFRGIANTVLAHRQFMKWISYLGHLLIQKRKLSVESCSISYQFMIHRSLLRLDLRLTVEFLQKLWQALKIVKFFLCFKLFSKFEIINYDSYWDNVYE